jgi:hypothetical protein
MNDEKLWSGQETADFLGIKEQTLANWRYRGFGPPFLKPGGAVRYRPQAVRDWLASRERRSTSDRGVSR